MIRDHLATPFSFPGDANLLGKHYQSVEALHSLHFLAGGIYSVHAVRTYLACGDKSPDYGYIKCRKHRKEVEDESQDDKKEYAKW